ncbi:MAG: hypothetical protein ACR2P1_03895 [Pseudomonadales bacterium]
MSRKSPTEFSDLFNRSPTPDSPPELDKRILEYARRNAPQPARREPLFLTVAATLSVACIGLLVVLRSGEVPLPELAAQRAPPTMPIANSRSAPPVSDSAAERRSKEVSALIPRTEPESEASMAQLSNAEPTETGTSANLAITQSRVKAFGTLQNQALSVPDASAPTQSGKLALDDSLGMTAPQGVAQAAMEEAFITGDKKSLVTATRVKFKVDNNGLVGNEDMQEALQEIKQLYADGKKSEAEKAYQELRARCKECDLPKSLKQALKVQDNKLNE